MSLFSSKANRPLSPRKVYRLLYNAGSKERVPVGGAYVVIKLLERFERAIKALSSNELAAEQIQSLCTQAALLPDAWDQRLQLSNAWNRAVRDAKLVHPDKDRFGIDRLDVVAEAAARYERSASAVTALVDAITERVVSAEQALAAQRLARTTTADVYRRAVEATNASIGAPATTDAADAALAGAKLGVGDLTWTQALTDQARTLTEAARDLGRHPGLTSRDFTLADPELEPSN